MNAPCPPPTMPSRSFLRDLAAACVLSLTTIAIPLMDQSGPSTVVAARGQHRLDEAHAGEPVLDRRQQGRVGIGRAVLQPCPEQLGRVAVEVGEALQEPL